MLHEDCESSCKSKMWKQEDFVGVSEPAFFKSGLNIKKMWMEKDKQKNVQSRGICKL